MVFCYSNIGNCLEIFLMDSSHANGIMIIKYFIQGILHDIQMQHKCPKATTCVVSRPNPPRAPKTPQC